MKLLTKGQHELYKNTKIGYIFKERFENNYLKDTGENIQGNMEMLCIGYVI